MKNQGKVGLLLAVFSLAVPVHAQAQQAKNYYARESVNPSRIGSSTGVPVDDGTARDLITNGKFNNTVRQSNGTLKQTSSPWTPVPFVFCDSNFSFCTSFIGPGSSMAQSLKPSTNRAAYRVGFVCEDSLDQLGKCINRIVVTGSSGVLLDLAQNHNGGLITGAQTFFANFVSDGSPLTIRITNLSTEPALITNVTVDKQ